MNDWTEPVIIFQVTMKTGKTPCLSFLTTLHTLNIVDWKSESLCKKERTNLELEKFQFQ